MIYTTNTRESGSSSKKATAASLDGCNHFSILTGSLWRKETLFRFVCLFFMSKANVQGVWRLLFVITKTIFFLYSSRLRRCLYLPLTGSVSAR